MIDIVMTAAIRPEIVKRTLLSIRDNIDYRPLRLIVDIAPVGDPDNTQEKTLEMIQSICNKYSAIIVIPRMLVISYQAEALRWTWKEALSDYVFQWEDDWVLRRPVKMNNLISIMEKHPKLGMLYLDRHRKSVLDYPGYRGVFKRHNKRLYIRKKGKSLGGPPALLRKTYMQDVIPLIQDKVCLDTMSHMPATKLLLSSWDLAVYMGESGKGNLVDDIGKEWRKKKKLKMVKKTNQGVQWQKIK
jgi:hypothetical protein